MTAVPLRAIDPAAEPEVPLPKPGGPVAVEALRPVLEARWDRYVRASPEATFFHQLGWRWLVERVFGHRAHYRVAMRGDRGDTIAGVLPLFYRMFAESMRHHGTPVYPCLFLYEILDRFPGETNLFFVHYQGKPVAAVLNLFFRDVIMPFYAGVDRHERPRGVDDYLYLSILRWGRENGFRTFDFGRSKRGTGAYKFKSRWGMDEVPLAYQYHLVKARELPNVSPVNPKYKAMIRLWQRLPLPVTRFLGPRIIARIP